MLDCLMDFWSGVTNKLEGWPVLPQILAEQKSLASDQTICMKHFPPSFLPPLELLFLNRVLDHTRPLPSFEQWERLDLISRNTITRIIILYTIHVILSAYSAQKLLINTIVEHGALTFMRMSEMVTRITLYEDNKDTREKQNATFCSQKKRQKPQTTVKMTLSKRSSVDFLGNILKAVTSAQWIDAAETIHQILIPQSVSSSFVANHSADSEVDIFIHSLKALWRRYVYTCFAYSTTFKDSETSTDNGILAIFDVPLFFYSLLYLELNHDKF
jgi:hypothetical protein